MSLGIGLAAEGPGAHGVGAVSLRRCLERLQQLSSQCCGDSSRMQSVEGADENRPSKQQKASGDHSGGALTSAASKHLCRPGPQQNAAGSSAFCRVLGKQGEGITTRG